MKLQVCLFLVTVSVGFISAEDELISDLEADTSLEVSRFSGSTGRAMRSKRQIPFLSKFFDGHHHHGERRQFDYHHERNHSQHHPKKPVSERDNRCKFANQSRHKVVSKYFSLALHTFTCSPVTLHRREVQQRRLPECLRR